MSSAERELLWLRRVREVSQLLSQKTPLQSLLPRILEAAVEITEAERGFMVRVLGKKPDGRPRVSIEAARGFNRTQLKGSDGQVSRTVVERVLETQTGIVTTRDPDISLLGASSIQSRRVLCILCVPMRLRDSIWGVLYLDHRFNPKAFVEEDIAVLATFADQAALAVETAELRADQEKLSDTMRELAELRKLAAERPAPVLLPRSPRYSLKFGSLVGGTPPMLALYEQIECAGRSRDPVLISGESGVGKLQVAREIHARSEFPRLPFVIIDCAGANEESLANALFGAGSALLSTGRGSLVMSGIEELSLQLQGRLSGVMRTRSLSLPDGASKPSPVRCRIVAITRADLRARVAAGTFREDLFYRLDVQRLHVPSLRERRDDIPHLIDTLTVRGGLLNIREDALESMTSYAWPGNVRELWNEVHRLCALGARQIIPQHLSEEVRRGSGVAGAAGAMGGKTLALVEKEMVVAALKDAGGNKAKAARRLGIPRSTLYGLIDRYGLR